MAILDKDKAQAVLKALTAAVKAVGEQHGLKMTVNLSYDPTRGSVRATVKGDLIVTAEDGMIEDVAVRDFKRLAKLLGLEASDLHATLNMGGRTFKIVGLKASARKKPILVVDDSGKRYVLDVPTVLRALGRPVPDYLAAAVR